MYFIAENYLYHPDNLLEYYSNKNAVYDKEEYIQNLTQEKNNIKTEIKRKLALVRIGPPSFKELESNKNSNKKRFTHENANFDQVAVLESYLNSDALEDFYKILPMKDYATQLKQRQNIDPTDLAKTNWFKEQIELVLG